MNFGIRDEVYKKICEIVSKHKYKFVIFGSRARGDYRPNSDIDIAILSEVPEKEKYEIRNEFDLIDMEYMVDIVFIDEVKKEALIKNIEKEGVCISWKGLRKDYKIIKML